VELGLGIVELCLGRVELRLGLVEPKAATAHVSFGAYLAGRAEIFDHHAAPLRASDAGAHEPWHVLQLVPHVLQARLAARVLGRVIAGLALG